MKRLALWSLGLVLAMACRSRPEAKDYAAPSGDFRITLVGTPEVSSESVGGLGPQTVYKLADGDMTYLFRRMDCPAEFAADASPDRLYDQFQKDILAAGASSSLQGQRPLIAGGTGTSGREFVIRGKTKRRGKPYEMIFRVFRVGTAVYVLNASMPPDDQDARARATAALDSFTILR